MVSFNASNLSDGTAYHDIEIENESTLNEQGFTKFRLPKSSNATQMVLWNEKYREFTSNYLKTKKIQGNKK